MATSITDLLEMRVGASSTVRSESVEDITVEMNGVDNGKGQLRSYDVSVVRNGIKMETPATDVPYDQALVVYFATLRRLRAEHDID